MDMMMTMLLLAEGGKPPSAIESFGWLCLMGAIAALTSHAIWKLRYGGAVDEMFVAVCLWVWAVGSAATLFFLPAAGAKMCIAGVGYMIVLVVPLATAPAQ